jgi:hypothetical protein
VHKCRSVAAAGAAIVLLASQSSTLAAEAVLSPEMIEAAALKLEDSATAAGALGYYTDPANGDFVIVVPDTIASSFDFPAYLLTQQVRVEARRIDQADVALTQKVLHGIASDSSLGWMYVSYGFDPMTGLVEAAGNLSPDVVVPMLGQVADFVHYVERPPAVATYSRYSDTAPFYGGDELYLGGGFCTGGLAVHDGSSSYMVTAAHCFGMGNHVYSPGNDLEIGQVVRWLDFIHASSDLELLGNKSYAGKIYVGDLDSSTHVSIKSAANPANGQFLYCFSGVTSLVNCNYEVVNQDETVCFDDQDGHLLGCADHVMQFRNAAGNAAPQDGDSGAPFYLPCTGGACARGIVTGQGCFSGVCFGYGFRWGTLSSELGVSITTS